MAQWRILRTFRTKSLFRVYEESQSTLTSHPKSYIAMVFCFFPCQRLLLWTDGIFNKNALSNKQRKQSEMSILNCFFIEVRVQL